MPKIEKSGWRQERDNRANLSQVCHKTSVCWESLCLPHPHPSSSSHKQKTSREWSVHSVDQYPQIIEEAVFSLSPSKDTAYDPLALHQELVRSLRGTTFSYLEDIRSPSCKSLLSFSFPPGNLPFLWSEPSRSLLMISWQHLRSRPLCSRSMKSGSSLFSIWLCFLPL